MIEEVKNLSDETMLRFLKVLSDYRQGVDITDKEFLAWQEPLSNVFCINDLEIILVKEAVERFGFLVRYLMNRTPGSFIKY